MHNPAFGHPLAGPRIPCSGSTPNPVPPDSVQVEKSVVQRVSPRQIAVPAPGRLPSFQEMFDIAVIGALHGQRVVVICMTRAISDDWQLWLARMGMPLPELEVLDARAACRIRWESFFSSRSYDMVIVHGVRGAFGADTATPTYVEQMVNAVPTGLIVLA